MLGYTGLGTSDEARYGDFKAYSGNEILGKHKTVDFFADLWTSLDHPRRRDIQPTQLKAYLDRMVIMDVLNRDGKLALHVRLIGTFVASYYGEISDKDVNEMNNERAAERIYEAARLLLLGNQPILTVTPALSKEKRHLEAIAFYMPLYDDDKNIVKILAYVDVVTLKEQTHNKGLGIPFKWRIF
ncbi:MAG: hypothetical protein COB37_04775 [Kordiimonadales bacterium]|nr:MAG: hypothetical protein COB37_04775 [Kordiimonadales bacterium]